MSNEITVKIKCELNELYDILKQKGFNIIDKFSLDDSYFIPNELETEKITAREILSKAILVRNITEKMPFKVRKKITFKKKEFDDDGNILKQTAINCEILNAEDAERLLTAIGYKKIMNIKEENIVYGKDGFELAIKDIENGDNLIEIETVNNNKEFDTIEKIKQKLVKLDIPVYTDNYFVKKAEIELEKRLRW